MPNYRQKNKKNKNKNRQKNQQQQQLQQQEQQNQHNQQQQNRSKNQNQNQNQQEEKTTQQQPQPQAQSQPQPLNLPIKNRQPSGNKDNKQSEGQTSQREQSNQQQRPKSKKSPKSPPISTSSAPPPLDSQDSSHKSHANAKANSPTEEEDVQRKVVDATASTITADTAPNEQHVKCDDDDNLNSKEHTATAPTAIITKGGGAGGSTTKTTSQQVNAETAVEREECNRIEDAKSGAHQKKLDNTEAAFSEKAAARCEEEECLTSRVSSDALVVQESTTMGNKDSKISGTSTSDANTAPATAMAGATSAVAAVGKESALENISSDARGSSARQTNELPTMSKTQMAKVIVHRIVQMPSGVVEVQQQNGGIQKDAQQAANARENSNKEVIGQEQGLKANEQKSEAPQAHEANSEKQNEGVVETQDAETIKNIQNSNVIIHKIAKEPPEPSSEENTADITGSQQQQAAQTKTHNAQPSADSKIHVQHSAPQTSGRQVFEDAANHQQLAAQTQNKTSVFEPLSDEDSKVIFHHIELESTSPTNYHVELPDADSPTSPLGKSTKQSILNKSIVQIQELSDESSSEYNDNPPLISEAESEPESLAGACSLDYSQQIRTLSPDSEDNYELVGRHTSQAQAQEQQQQQQQDHKQRRAQKRVALETHFLPQMLSPRYLDSILEENSDMSDARSDCSENPLMSTLSGDDLRDHTASKVRKANEVFPRSNLDFTRRHAKKQLGALPKTTTPAPPIREEPIAMVVEAKIIDNTITQSAQECCTRLSSEHTPESEAAEVIYLSSSASSSLSDLLEQLDAEAEGGGGGGCAGDDEYDTSSRSTIDLDTDVREIITKPISGGGGGADGRVVEEDKEKECESTAALESTSSDSRESTPVNQASAANDARPSEDAVQNETQKIFANNNNNKTINTSAVTAAAEAISTNIDANTENEDTTTNTSHIESRIFENLKSLQMLTTSTPIQERALSSSTGGSRTATNTSESETETELSSATITERCEYSRSFDTDTNDNISSSSASSSSIINNNNNNISNTNNSSSSGGTGSGSGSAIESDNSSSRASIISNIETNYPLATTIATSDSLNVDPAVLLENIELEMNNVRDILNSHIITADVDTTTSITGAAANGTTRSSEEFAYANNIYTNNNKNNNSASSGLKKAASPSPPPIPPPPTTTTTSRASDYQSDYIGIQKQGDASETNATQQSAAPPIPTRAPHEIIHYPTTHTHEQPPPPPQPNQDQTDNASQISKAATTNSFSSLKSALNSLSLLGRQESSESHCSDSTQHSQCTAINVGGGSRPHTDHELTPPGWSEDNQQQQPQHTPRTYYHDDWKYTTTESDREDNSKLSANTNPTYAPHLEAISGAAQKDAPIKKLRLLCTETLASMPYGEQVLVELATVAQNIGELQAAKTPTQQPITQETTNFAAQPPKVDDSTTTMPYPLPQLPHISELQMSIGGDERSQRPAANSSSTSSASLAPISNQTHAPHTHIVPIQLQDDTAQRLAALRDFKTTKIMHSPPAPPVPTPPTHYSAGGGGAASASDAPWLALPTTADPNVLVCLSPAQQQQLSTDTAAQKQQQPDQLLDAHQKFLERRGYHELSNEQVKSLNATVQKEEEQILKMAAYMKKLRKSLTPPPPPVPPPPVPAKSSETAAKAINSQAAAARISSIGSSSGAYDATQKYRNANEQQQQRTVTFANGEQQQQNHNTGKTADAAANAFSVAAGSSLSASSSFENNSRQSGGGALGAQGASTYYFGEKEPPTFSGVGGDTRRQYSNANTIESTTSSRSTKTVHLYGNNNQEKTENKNYSFPTSAAGKMQGVESELAKMFPSMGTTDIFDNSRKRFSNIESSTNAHPTGGGANAYCAQLQSTLPKRYSNIETHTYEAKKRMENGEVVYDYSDTRHEHNSDGDKSLKSASMPTLSRFPVREGEATEKLLYPVAGDGISQRSGNSEIMSAIKLNTTTDQVNTNNNSAQEEGETKEKEKAKMTNFRYSGVPIHDSTVHTSNAAIAPSAFSDHTFDKQTTTTTKTTSTAEKTIREEYVNNKNNQEHVSGGVRPPISSGGVSGSGEGNVNAHNNSTGQNGSGNSSAFEEFRQHAKQDGGTYGAYGVREQPATAPPLHSSGDSKKHSAFNFQHDKLFKDIDTLSQQLHKELEEGKAQREQREKSASLYDLSRTQWNFKDHFEKLKKERHEHMQELEREIERSMRSRQLKGWTNGANAAASAGNAMAHTLDIPIRVEQSNGYAPTPAGGGGARRNSDQPRAYNIPIELENGGGAAPPKVPAPPSAAHYDTVDDASRFRRAESMFNLSENARRPQPQPPHSHYTATYERPQSSAAATSDDWARYASDFGSSENIARPFAREVEICYQRQRPRTIRAPRLSASTNDLSSSTQSYDTYNAYNVRRSHAPMMQPVSRQQQQQRPHHSSCYSVLERDPNPTYISTTTRRGVSPAPVQQQHGPHEPPFTPVAPERQRRASLPREIQAQQLKYISSKEEELRMEFERLQNERRRLLDELNHTSQPQQAPPTPTTPTTLQMPQHPSRDIYRPVPKLPTLTEDEVFRQQMAEEWLNKVAEREERRLHKIIKISKVNEGQQHHKPDISDEFLKRVHERRTKLAMPADSDWESGAESHPAAAGHASESEAEGGLPIKVIEGKSEADLRQLPRHLREFARFSNHNEEQIDGGGHRVVHQEEERRQEANANSLSSALKKSSVVKTVKIARHPEIVGGGEPSHRVPASVQQQQQQQQQQQSNYQRHQHQQPAYNRTSSVGEQVFAEETAPFSTDLPPISPTPTFRHPLLQPNSPLFSNNSNNNKLPVSPSFEEMFATSPFKSRIYDEFQKFWQRFDHNT